MATTPRTHDDFAASYHPSIWGDSFTDYHSEEEALSGWRKKAEALKGEILAMVSRNKKLAADERCNANLSLIDAIQRLGVAYHFEEQIEEELAWIAMNMHQDQLHNDADNDNDGDLGSIALRFRLLREHGHNISFDVFKKFMDRDGSFKKSLSGDMVGLLGLYEAAHLRVEGEVILDDALIFATRSIRSVLPSLSPMQAEQACTALYRPLRRRLPRLEAMSYFSIYEGIEGHNATLLHFAKLDFNILQNTHKKELSFISKWWKDLGCASNFPFARDRHVELYFWVLGVYFEPKYAMARRFLVRMICLVSITDDIYDSYGTKEELELLTKAVVRWDASATVDLPGCMKLYYQNLLNLYHEFEKEVIKQGMPVHGLQYAKESMKRLCTAYFEERKWIDCSQQNLPTFGEYMGLALVTTGYEMLSTASIVGMGDVASEEAFKWIASRPKIIESSLIICRFMDDIVSRKFEQERVHPPSGIQCYAKQYGVSEEEACDVFRDGVDRAWKDINESLMRPTPVSREVLTRVMNLCRVIDQLYKESDGYTHVTAEVKECIVSLLCNPLRV